MQVCLTVKITDHIEETDTNAKRNNQSKIIMDSYDVNFMIMVDKMRNKGATVKQ
jgi:hypothetical protein